MKAVSLVNSPHAMRCADGLVLQHVATDSPVHYHMLRHCVARAMRKVGQGGGRAGGG